MQVMRMGHVIAFGIRSFGVIRRWYTIPNAISSARIIFIVHKVRGMRWGEWLINDFRIVLRIIPLQVKTISWYSTLSMVPYQKKIIRGGANIMSALITVLSCFHRIYIFKIDLTKNLADLLVVLSQKMVIDHKIPGVNQAKNTNCDRHTAPM